MTDPRDEYDWSEGRDADHGDEMLGRVLLLALLLAVGALTWAYLA